MPSFILLCSFFFFSLNPDPWIKIFWIWIVAVIRQERITLPSNLLLTIYITFNVCAKQNWIFQNQFQSNKDIDQPQPLSTTLNDNFLLLCSNVENIFFSLHFEPYNPGWFGPFLLFSRQTIMEEITKSVILAIVDDCWDMRQDSAVHCGSVQCCDVIISCAKWSIPLW